MSRDPTASHPTAPDPTAGAGTGGGHTPTVPRASRSLVLLGGFAALTACLLVFGVIAEDVQEQEANALDGFATSSLHGLASPGLDGFMNGLTTMGSTLVVITLFSLTLLLLLWRHRRREALFLAVAIGGSVILDEVLKVIFHRPRPQLAWAQVQPEYSFPSGHSMNSLVFYLALAIIVSKLWSRRAGLLGAVLAIGLAVLIGTSRIYLGYHYLTDVVGGILAGLVWLLIVSWVFDMGILPRTRTGPVAPS